MAWSAVEDQSAVEWYKRRFAGAVVSTDIGHGQAENEQPDTSNDRVMRTSQDRSAVTQQDVRYMRQSSEICHGLGAASS
jgi:hypothetical protein